MQCCLFLSSFSLYLQCLYLYSFFCGFSIKRLLNVSASTAYTDSCDCLANYITNMNYNIRLTVISINCKNCSIGCPYNLFLRFPPLRVGAGFSGLAISTPAIWCRVFQFRVFHPCIFDGAGFFSLAFSVAPTHTTITSGEEGHGERSGACTYNGGQGERRAEPQCRGVEDRALARESFLVLQLGLLCTRNSSYCCSAS